MRQVGSARHCSPPPAPACQIGHSDLRDLRRRHRSAFAAASAWSLRAAARERQLRPAVATRVLPHRRQGWNQAVWFERKGRGEYYGFDGKSLKKAYLLNPLEFSRITSGFTEERMHPIMRDWRAHKGVDFAAPIGTRVRSAADGVVEFIGQQRGYGNVVVLKHAKEQSTLYAHLQDFADGLKIGSKVDQGDIIGTVRMSGWSTGPHLHYELRVAGGMSTPCRSPSCLMSGPSIQPIAAISVPRSPSFGTASPC
jgi:murein DD-endopeptidase MepM/ murein hydrolase activator NlpD